MEFINYVISNGNYYIDDEWDYKCNEWKTNNIDKATKFETYKEADDYLSDYKHFCKLEDFRIYRITSIIEIATK